MGKIMRDIDIIFEHDPAVRKSISGYIEVILTYPGLHAVWFYRAARRLCLWRIPVVPRLISQFARFLTGIEIHPGADIRGRLFIDHGMGVVIGATAIIGDNVVMYSGVALGSRSGSMDLGHDVKRHPTIGDNVIIGSGVKILGDIRVGNNVRIGANAVVLRDIPDDFTAVGVPAREVIYRGQERRHKLMNRLSGQGYLQ